MTGRRHRISALSGNNAVRPALSGKRPLTSTLAILPRQQCISDPAQLKTDVDAQLQALKSYIDYEHASIIKQIEGQCSKLKKRLKSNASNLEVIKREQQERQDFSTIGEAADSDWRNFLADHDEDTQEHQNSVAVLCSKLDASATQFTKIYVPVLVKSMEANLDAIKKNYARSAKSARRLSTREKMNAKLTESE